MEPQVQYVTTADGVRIACWSVGEGPPLAFLPNYPAGIRTIGRHITNIYNKIGARGRANAASYALRHRSSAQ